MELHPSQATIAKDKHRFRVVACGRRFGKTTLAVVEMIGKAVSHKDSRVCYIAPTYQQARDIAWSDVLKVARPIITKVNDSRLEITVKTKGEGEGKIFFRGWESIETLRGQAFDFIVIDEVAMMRNFDYNWQEIIRPTLTDKKGQVLFTSTPKGFNHFYDLYNKAGVDDDYASFHYRSKDNPHLPETEIDKAKEELTDSAFAQEYEAEFRTSVGLTHKDWDRELHLVKNFDVPETWPKARGVDFGRKDATARVRVAIFEEGNETTWFLERCYKVAEMTIADHALAIRTQDYGQRFIPTFGDPSGGQWFLEFAHHGLTMQPASKEGVKSSWLEFCIEKVNQMLKPRVGYLLHLPDGQQIKDPPKLLVLDTPENQQIVKEFETQEWRTTKDGQTLSAIDESGGHFDLLAALRYLVVSYRGTNRSRVRSVPRQELFDAYGNPTV